MLWPVINTVLDRESFFGINKNCAAAASGADPAGASGGVSSAPRTALPIAYSPMADSPATARERDA
jgi:hypothetical protein